MRQPTFEQYLRDTASAGVIDHTLRASVNKDGRVTFYIHPQGQDGPTLDFVVQGHLTGCVNVDGKPVPHI